MLFVMALAAAALVVSTPIAQGQERGGSTLTDSVPLQICAAEGHVIHQMVVDTIVEAYRRIGMEIEFTWLPNRRSLIAANTGICAAEIMRIPGMEKHFENLRPVPQILTHLEGVVYVNADQADTFPEFRSWADLEGLDTSIILGEVYAEHGTRDLNVRQVRHYSQLFTMLEQRKTDVGIGIRSVGDVELARNFPDSAIVVRGTPLARAPMYHYVHHNYAYLIEPLYQALKQMADDGTIDRLNHQALERLKRQDD